MIKSSYKIRSKDISPDLLLPLTDLILGNIAFDITGFGVVCGAGERSLAIISKISESNPLTKPIVGLEGCTGVIASSMGKTNCFLASDGDRTFLLSFETQSPILE